MRKFLSLIVIVLFLSACASNSPQPNSNADQVATVVSATLAALPPTEIPATQPVDGFSTNGQLQGTLAFIRNNNLWININGVESQLTSDAIGLPELWYSNPKISPDGTKIAYLKNAGTDVRTLMVYDLVGKNMTQLANDVAWVPPALAWSSNSQQIYYPVSNGFDTTTGLETIVIKSSTSTTGEIQEYGQFAERTGCGGASPDPADGISSYENMLRSTGGGYVFDLSQQNNFIIYGNTCYNVGLSILDLSTKQARTLDENVTGAVISPDGSKIAAAAENSIVIFNTITGSIENTFPTSEKPRAFLWDANSKEILYSTSRVLTEVKLDDNLDLEGWASRSFKLNMSTLWVVSVESGESQKIIEVEAHDLKPIFIKGQRVLVVIVENSNKLFDYITQGNRDNLIEYFPTANILEVNLANLVSNPITNNTQQASFFK